MSDAMVRDAIDAVTAKNWTVDGETVSLADVGYSSVGIDEGWEGCGQGVTVNGRKTQHYANGTPAINNKFPDMVRSHRGRQLSSVCKAARQYWPGLALTCSLKHWNRQGWYRMAIRGGCEWAGELF